MIASHGTFHYNIIVIIIIKKAMTEKKTAERFLQRAGHRVRGRRSRGGVCIFRAVGAAFFVRCRPVALVMGRLQTALLLGKSAADNERNGFSRSTKVETRGASSLNKMGFYFWKNP